GIFSAEERTAQAAGQDPAALHAEEDVERESLAQSVPVQQPKAKEQEPPAAAHSSTELIESHQGRTADAPLCMTCGTKMRPAGSCYVCEGCGSTSGCS
ncbi:MAG: vitamin B12-dependent ribonucleotide reductase, partial [Actinoallomurus sp.]